MYIILCYDVNKKRVSKVRKICLKYLKYTQRSVYEGDITAAKLKRLKAEIKKVIDVKTDQVIIYQMQSVKFANKDKIGVSQIHTFAL